MRSISIKQPLASLIVTPREDNPNLGIKDIENRTWKTNFRGTVLIHASAKPAGIPSELLTNDQFDSLNLNPESPLWLSYLSAGKYITSAIIGKVDIVDCVINHQSIWAEKCHESIILDENLMPKKIIHTYYPIVWNWVLANPVLFDKPILNIKGKLSFWDFELPFEHEYVTKFEK